MHQCSTDLRGTEYFLVMPVAAFLFHVLRTHTNTHMHVHAHCDCCSFMCGKGQLQGPAVTKLKQIGPASLEQLLFCS